MQQIGHFSLQCSFGALYGFATSGARTTLPPSFIVIAISHYHHHHHYYGCATSGARKTLLAQTGSLLCSHTMTTFYEAQNLPIQCNAMRCNTTQCNGGETSLSDIFMTQSSGMRVMGSVQTDGIARFSTFKFGTKQLRLQLYYSPKT